MLTSLTTVRLTAFAALLAITTSGAPFTPVTAVTPGTARPGTHAVAHPVASLPPIPATMPTIMGPIIVHQVPHLICGTKLVMGCFAPDTRWLGVRSDVPIETEWQAVYHELFHVTLYDMGQSLANHKLEERLADAIASARVNEMQAALPTPPPGAIP